MNCSISQKKKYRGWLFRISVILATFYLLFLFTPLEAAATQEALKVPDAPELYQRVLSLPDAKIVEQLGSEKPENFVTLPIFSVRYVYGIKEIDGENWLEIGKEPVGGRDGWIKKTSTEEWKSMLVMQFEPRGQRDRVLFFKEKGGLQQCIAAEMVGDHFESLYEQVQSSSLNRDLLAAIEPRNSIDANSQPYLMPILDWAMAEYENGSEINLVQVASLNAGSRESGEETVPDVENGNGEGYTTLPGNEDNGNEGIRDFKVGIVFVIDTTKSMDSYIERTYEAVEAVYDKLTLDDNIDKASFGIVGYRDDVAYSNRIEYVTKVFQDLDPAARRETVLRNIKKVKAAKSSTEGWNEDAVAGLHQAINNMNWGPFSARIIVLISDAGARLEDDPLASIPNMSMSNITEMARNKDIVIFPVHLRTEEAVSVGNASIAENQYRELGITGDINVNKYTGVEGGDLDIFSSFVGDFANQIREALLLTSLGEMSERPNIDTFNFDGDDVFDGFENDQKEATENNQPIASEDSTTTEIGRMAVNEIFRSQLEYLGTLEGDTIPPFYRAWTSDSNLANPQLSALSVRIFLSRNQLNGLAQSLSEIVSQARASELDPANFFGLLQSLSATTANDPNQNTGVFNNMTESGLLPSYLSQLPYRSKVLELTQEDWLNWGLTGQLEFIDELEFKLTMYQQMNDDTDRWVNFGSTDPGQDSYPVSLYLLP